MDEGVLIVFDDGGFSHQLPDCQGKNIGLDCYKRLLELAEENEIQIPIAVTAAFIDVHGLAGLEMTNPEAEKLVAFLVEHQDKLPVWNHGLTHQYGSHFCEFDSYIDGESVPEKTQRHHLKLSQQIFESVGLGLPRVFVPPAHAWKEGVTDRIASDLGFGAIAVRQYEKKPLLSWVRTPSKPYLRQWSESIYLKTFFRLGLGIEASSLNLGFWGYIKAHQFINPQNALVRLLVYRQSGMSLRPHHFFAHIQNLQSPSSYYWWSRLIKDVKGYYG